MQPESAVQNCSLSVNGSAICWLWNTFLAINQWVGLREHQAHDPCLIILEKETFCCGNTRNKACGASQTGCTWVAVRARTEKPTGSHFAALRWCCPPLLTSSLLAQPHQLLTRALQSIPGQPSAASLTAPTPRVGKLTLSLSVKALTSFIAPVRPTMACLVMLHPNMYYFGPNKHSYYSTISNLRYFSEVPAGMSLQLWHLW